MQSLDVISVNIWHILISLCNLLILYLILKRFLFKPVRRMLSERKAALDKQYADAADAVSAADANRAAWDAKMLDAKNAADDIIKKGSEQAQRRSEIIVAEAREKAGVIIDDAKTQAELERRHARADIKRDIADISTALTEKLLDRELTEKDHRALIDSVISDIGEANDSDN